MSEPPVVEGARPALPSPAPTQTSDPVQPVAHDRLAGAIGEENLAVVSLAEHAWAARLQLVAVREAQAGASLSDATRIGGYPLRGALVEVSGTTLATLVATATANDSYTVGVRQRCRDSERIGMRFERGPARVEVSLGRPCGLALWSFQHDGQQTLWGEVMSESARQQVLGVVDSVLE
jgi:hypothetical protein